MFYVDYNETSKKFNLFFRDIPRDDFEYHVNFLKSLYMHFNHTQKVWEYEEKRADEFQIWFNKKNIETTYSQTAIDKINEIKNSYRKQELVIDKTIKLDESILTPTTKLFEFQKEDIQYCLERNRVWNCNDAGTGKAQPLTAKILTPTGWKLMRDIEVGDFVIGSDGKPKQVLSTYYHNNKDIYKVTFSDKTNTECCNEHLWSYYSQNDDMRGGNIRTESLDFLLKDKLKTKKGRRKYRIPNLSNYVEFEKKELPLHPYIMGCLLGDGGFSQNHVYFTNMDIEIINKIKLLLPDEIELNKIQSKYGYSLIKKHNKNRIRVYKNKIITILAIFGLMGKKSFEKYIPDIYKINDIESRIELLHGLMDTDGTISKDNTNISYSTSSIQLRDDIIFICQSLGCKCTYREKKPFFTYKGIRKQGRINYNISIFPPNGLNMFFVTRKSILQKDRLVYKPNRYFEKIEYVGKKHAKCIVIDSEDHLYITDDFILTHNSVECICTFTTLYTQNKIDKVLIIPPIGLSYHWKYEILKFVNVFKDEDIAIVENKNKLNIFAENIDKKIIIISNHLLADAILYYKKTESKSRSKKQIRWKKFVDIKQEWNAKNLFLLADESHWGKHLTAVKTKALQSILPDFSYRMFCTATPFINKVEHVYSNATMLDRSLIPMSENAFKIWISDYIGDKYGPYNIHAYNQKNVNIILDRLKDNLFLKRLKEDIPEMKFKRVLKPIYLSFTQMQKDLYREILSQEIKKLEDEFNVITWKMILMKFHMVYAIIDNIEMLKKNTYDNDKINSILKAWTIEKDPKLQMLDYKINEYVVENDEKLIVFCQHPHNLDMFYERYKKYNPIIIHGNTEGKDKELAREEKRIRFNTDKKCKLAFLSFMTSSAGGNWNEQCHRIIFYSISNDATLCRQALDRHFRINNTSDALVEIFTYPETIDNLRYQRSMNRMDLNDKLGKEITDEELKNLLRGII